MEMIGQEDKFMQVMNDAGVSVNQQKEAGVDTDTSGETQKSSGSVPQEQAAKKGEKSAQVPQNGNLEAQLPREKIEQLQNFESHSQNVISAMDDILDDFKSASDDDAKQDALISAKSTIASFYPKDDPAVIALDGLNDVQLKQWVRETKRYHQNFIKTGIQREAAFLSEKEVYNRQAEKSHPWLNDPTSELYKEFKRLEKEHKDLISKYPKAKLILANALKYEELRMAVESGKIKPSNLQRQTGNGNTLRSQIGRGNPTDARPRTNSESIKTSAKSAFERLRSLDPGDARYESSQIEAIKARNQERMERGQMNPVLAQMIQQDREKRGQY